ncbi:energy transducer TonB, partial [Corallococcus sp. CA031C]
MGKGSSTDWRERRKKRAPWRYLVAAVLALLGQAAIVGFVLLASLLQTNLAGEKRPTPRPTSVAVRPLTSDQWAKNRGPTSPQV